jgi:hypothetical protein
MKKLVGVLIGLALTVCALPTHALPPGYPHYCDNDPWDCPDFLGCRLLGCIDNICEYNCW